MSACASDFEILLETHSGMKYSKLGAYMYMHVYMLGCIVYACTFPS